MPGESLLIVDDDRFVHQALEGALDGRAIRVLHAYEPEEGLRLAIETRPDVILLDVNLPRMDGLKLCRHLKETPSVRDVPILFLTVEANVQRLARALEIGATDYIKKPFDPTELRARVEAALRLGRMINLLRDQAWIDALTGLKNRAALDDALDAASAAYERVGQPSALLLLDLDHFKRVNDEYGHGVGDELLRGVGAAIRASCRPYDTSARYGGDEFAVVFTQTEGEGARVAAERVLAAVHQVSPACARGKVLAHCSAGLCSTQGGSARFAAADLVKRADEALYEAKRAGGGRLCTRTLPG
ncbi:MAG TPA: diguanylate cyclase [Myxococcota bacterium]|jgi:two-component system cell cycle response regulator|nr:diguanylate cyclase [Myxococcota bacterium]